MHDALKNFRNGPEFEHSHGQYCIHDRLKRKVARRGWGVCRECWRLGILVTGTHCFASWQHIMLACFLYKVLHTSLSIPGVVAGLYCTHPLSRCFTPNQFFTALPHTRLGHRVRAGICRPDAAFLILTTFPCVLPDRVSK